MLVTGAAAGIGLACAEAFACAGAVVVMADIHEPVDQAARLVQAGYAAVPYRCDVSDTRAVEAMVEWIVATSMADSMRHITMPGYRLRNGPWPRLPTRSLTARWLSI